MKTDVQNLKDIKILVDSFYGEVQRDAHFEGELAEEQNGELEKWQKFFFRKLHISKMKVK